jgi:acyl-CoA hydrolase
MTAINSAISIDLTGQVCADSIGWRLYSGVGGQMDFIRGAALAPEGRAIIALPSTASGDRVSRITPFLQEGAGVVTTRAHVRTVVTEYGVAELYGKSICQRAEALIAIAHPAFRDELTAQARKTHWL